MSKGENQPKLFATHAGAMWRMGLRELRAVFYPGSNIAQQQTEHGIFGTKTQGEVAEERRSTEPDRDEEPQQSSMIQDRIERMPEAEPDDNMELEIED
ncbi:hypothetical protein K2Y11_09580 [bacterium]|nr:hypothetical protein [bacterium]